jgi:hypothetical protein
MSRSGIEQMLFLLDEAFEGHEEHGLLVNLATVRDEEWLLWQAPGGVRTIAQMVEHVGECKFMYANYAFGDGKMSWHEFDSRNAALPDKPGMIGWLREGQAVLRGHVEALADDSELTVLRRAPWGKEYETRWLIGVMIEHDLYHAGEINHIRALAQGNDAWPDYS